MADLNNSEEAQAGGNQVDTLHLALKIALGNGFKDWWDTPYEITKVRESGEMEVVVPDDPDLLGWGYHLVHINELIYDEGFARALWGYGNNDKCQYCGLEMWLVHMQPCPFAVLPAFAIKPLWKYHLQNMVIHFDPLGYLSDHIEEIKITYPVIRSIKSTDEVHPSETYLKVSSPGLYAVSLDTVKTAASSDSDTDTESGENADE